MTFGIKDSGVRQEFDTGSVRDTREGKGRYDLISLIAEARLARWYEQGAAKYGDRNWELGQPMMRYFDSARRHLNYHAQGHRDEDHLAAAAWNVFAMIHTEEMIARGLLDKGLDDRPSYIPPTDPEDYVVEVWAGKFGWLAGKFPKLTYGRALRLAETLRRDRECPVRIMRDGVIKLVTLPEEPPLADIE